MDLQTTSVSPCFISKINSLALQVENFDAFGSGSAQPVSVRAEDKAVDNIAGLEAVEVLALVQIPEHGDAILSARRS